MSPTLPGIKPPPGGRTRQEAASLDVRPVPLKVPASVREPILGEAAFREAFVRERRRADRFGAPFAVLVLDRGDGALAAAAWASIVRGAMTVKRALDAAGWLEQDAVLAILLPELTAQGATRVLQRVRDEVAKRAGEVTLAALSLRLYAHGDRTGPDGTVLPSVDLLVEGFLELEHRRWRDGSKRALDIAGSAAALFLFSPVLLASYLAVKWTSRGPALYRQIRVGGKGRAFTIFKFRTMYVNAGHGIHQDYMSWFITSSGKQSHDSGAVFKLTNDPRVTPVGHFLRKTSIDELPQFWNVLRGEMSLVGPRPPIPSEVDQYQPWHRRRVLDAKPGITGLWQVNGRSRTTFDEMVRLDLRYARTRSLWMDIKILLATPRAVLSGKGAC